MLKSYNNPTISGISDEKYQEYVNSHKYKLYCDEKVSSNRLGICEICNIFLIEGVEPGNEDGLIWFFQDHNAYCCNEYLMRQVLE